MEDLQHYVTLYSLWYSRAVWNLCLPHRLWYSRPVWNLCLPHRLWYRRPVWNLCLPHRLTQHDSWGNAGSTSGVCQRLLLTHLANRWGISVQNILRGIFFLSTLFNTLCRKILGSNQEILRLWNWRSDALTTRIPSTNAHYVSFDTLFSCSEACFNHWKTF
jgi:hypothetical protein